MAKNVDLLKPFLCISTCNPNSTDFWKDPWLFETSLAFKPCFISIDLDLEHLSCADFIYDNTINFDKLCALGQQSRLE